MKTRQITNTRIHIADEHHARLKDKYNVSRQAIRLALMYVTNSELAENIRRDAKQMLEEEADAVILREDNQKQDNGKKAKTAGRVPPAQKDTDKGSTGRQRGHSDRHDGEPVRPVSGMGKQDLRRALQSSPRSDGDVSARSNTRA